jgi:hypothetical protein
MEEIEIPVLITAIGTLGGLLLLTFRLFLNGTLLSRTTVPREDYDKQVSIVSSYADRFGEQTDAVRSLTQTVATQTATIARLTEQLARAKGTKAVSSRVRSDRSS